jgi:hypothetical protein
VGGRGWVVRLGFRGEFKFKKDCLKHEYIAGVKRCCLIMSGR